MGKVVIEVYGGVAEVTSNPDNVEVEILDWDDFKEWGRLIGEHCDVCGRDTEDTVRTDGDSIRCIRHYYNGKGDS